MTKRFLRCWAVAAVLLFVSTQAVAAVELRMGVYTSNKPTEMIAMFRPILVILERKLAESLRDDVHIKLKIASTYDEGRRQLVDGEVDIARFGPVSYVLAKEQQPGISILATETKRGGKTFHGIIATTGGSGITSIEQLRGRSFAFGNETSTIGRYLSQLYLLNHGIRADDLSAYVYLGQHDKVGAIVATGRFAAGALNEGTFDKLVHRGKKLDVLAKFPVPTKPWLARAGLSGEMRRALTEALLDLNDQRALKALKQDGFVAGDDADYDGIRAAVKRNVEFFAPRP